MVNHPTKRLLVKTESVPGFQPDWAFSKQYPGRSTTFLLSTSHRLKDLGFPTSLLPYHWNSGRLTITHLFLFYLLSHLWEYLPIFSDKRRCFAAFLPILRIFESTMWKISQSPKLMFSTAFSSEMSHMARTAPLMFWDVMASQYVSTRDGMIPIKKESE